MASNMPCPDNFRDYVTLEEKTSVSDGMGGYIDTWSTVDSFWAKVVPLTANQRLYARQLEHNVTYKMYTRYRSDISISIDRRIAWRSRVFQVQGIIDVEERRRFLEVMLSEGEAT